MPMIKVYSLEEEGYVYYDVPTKEAAMRRSEQTWGTSYDRVERKHIEGGIPEVWKRIG